MNIKTQNSKLKTQNSKLKTQNSKLKTQNSIIFYKIYSIFYSTKPLLSLQDFIFIKILLKKNLEFSIKYLIIKNKLIFLLFYFENEKIITLLSKYII